MRLDINPDFTVEDGDQLYLLYAVLHARRIETMHDGIRWQDIKRYGIRITHTRDGEEPIVLEPYDLRTAVQIPTEATSEGLPENPR